MQASDPRDFIYALTGIAKDAVETHLYPDYTKHVADIYTDVARNFLTEGKLRTLWLCSHPRQIPNLPSWVPDFSTIWSGEHRYFSGGAGYSSDNAIYAACGNSTADVRFSSRDSKLSSISKDIHTTRFLRPNPHSNLVAH